MRRFSGLRGWRRVLAFLTCGLVFLILLAALWALLVPRPPLLDGVPFSVAIYDRHGRLLRLGLAADEKYRIFTPLKGIAPALREGTLLYEDRYFYQHIGVNPVSLLRAAQATYLGGGRRLGASTVTMQLARLRLKLETGNVWGKLRQIERALAYERHYSKEEIFEAYLNIAPYGGNIEGCGAAAQIYFQKAADRLDLIESLSLVSVPQNPARRNPLAVRRLDETGGRDAALEEARARLYALWLDNHPEDSGSAFMNRLPLRVHTPAELPFSAPHVTTEALQLFPGRRAIHTSLDSRQQQLLERMITAMTRRNRSLGVNNAAALLLHWPSMEVRALAGSADFFNPAIEGQIDGTRARRSPGSTLKPFIYALALDQGLIHPRSLLYDTPRSFKGYDPENADQEFKGPLHATEALQMSRNIPAISLANELGRTPGEMDLYTFLRRAGVDFPHGRDHYGLTLVLGGAELSMRELASLYALLPNQGRYRELRLYRTETGWASPGGQTAVTDDATGAERANPADAGLSVVVDDASSTVAQPEDSVAFGSTAMTASDGTGESGVSDTSSLLSPEAALVALRMIRALPAGQRMRNASIVGRIPLYWKTGTSNGLRDAWTAGVFGPYVLVVWAGDFNNAANQHFVGLRTAAPLFWDIADALYNSENLRDQAMQGLEGLNLIRIPVCAATGDVDTSLCADTAETWFIPGVSPIADSGVYRRVLIDKASGLRACVEEPGKTERMVLEFWPTDLLRLFRQAGVLKPSPPPFLPECEGGVVYGPHSAGLPPQILSPKEGVTYHRSVTRPEGSVITLHASGDADVTDFYWFSGPSFIGRSTPAGHIVWTPPGGINTISVVDNLGRSSSVKIVVQQSE